MDYVYNYNDMQFFAETKNDIEERMQRRLTYYRMYLYAYMVGKISKEKTEGYKETAADRLKLSAQDK